MFIHSALTRGTLSASNLLLEIVMFSNLVVGIPMPVSLEHPTLALCRVSCLIEVLLFQADGHYISPSSEDTLEVMCYEAAPAVPVEGEAHQRKLCFKMTEPPPIW